MSRQPSTAAFVDRMVEELEAPRAIEGLAVVVADGVHREPAETRQLRARPWVDHARDYRTGAFARTGKTDHPTTAAMTARTAPTPNSADGPRVL